ncbi:MAG: hypothetical protein H6700_01130 [Myxococcales bacterium]|nr:hypothetical protein [Myxococcales bacterium]
MTSPDGVAAGGAEGPARTEAPTIAELLKGSGPPPLLGGWEPEPAGARAYLEGSGWGPALRAREPGLPRFQGAAAQVIRAILERWGVALLADETGLGKTYTAMEAVGPQAVLVAPPALHAKWREALRARDYSWRVVSHAALSRDAREPALHTVVVDEAHHFRNDDTRRYRHLAALIGYQRVLFLTATPIWNSRRDVVNLLRLGLSAQSLALLTGLSQDALLASCPADAVDALLDALCVRRDREAARRLGVTQLGSLGRSREQSLHSCPDDLLPVISRAARAAMGQGEPATLHELTVLRRLASSGLAAHHSLQRAQRFLLQASAAGSVGRGVSREEARALGAQTVLPFWYQLPPTQRELERRLDAVRAGLAALEEHLIPWEKLRALPLGPGVLVFTEYRDTARLLHSELRGSAVVCGGRAALREALGAFGTGRVSPLICTPVGTEGLDIPARTIVHFDAPWSPARLLQRRGRAGRLGSAGGAEELLLLPSRTLDHRLRQLERLTGKARLTSWGSAPSLLARALEEEDPEQATRAPLSHFGMYEGRDLLALGHLPSGVGIQRGGNGWCFVGAARILSGPGVPREITGSLRFLLNVLTRGALPRPDLSGAALLEHAGRDEEAREAILLAQVVASLSPAARFAHAAGRPVPTEHIQRLVRQRAGLL